MNIRKDIVKSLAGATFVSVAAVGIIANVGIVNAATSVTSDLSQKITAGVMSTFIANKSGEELSTRKFSMESKNVSTSVQTSKGEYGNDNARIYVDNPGASPTFNLTIAAAAKDGKWTSGTNQYAFNASSSDKGQLTVNPSEASVVTEASSGANVSKGTKATFTADNTPISLISVADGSAGNFWRGYITGVGLYQTIPAGTLAGDYTLNLVQTLNTK